jgi:hypothetical protein
MEEGREGPRRDDRGTGMSRASDAQRGRCVKLQARLRVASFAREERVRQSQNEISREHDADPNVAFRPHISEKMLTWS